MTRCIQRVLNMGAVACSWLCAEMVITRDHVSVNGSLSKMANGDITFVARFDSGEKTLTIKRKDTDLLMIQNGYRDSENPGCQNQSKVAK
jgi:hypothetical protein